MKIIKAVSLVLLAASLSGCTGEYLSGRSDLDCSDITGPVWVGNLDPHNLDGDGDGWGCE